ncbi:MAG: hypothetical protein IKH46_03690 [Lachnospiraceae bacterium]|nr:hypothetical protein [Lachnospiraceae bacterium]
MTEDSMLAVNVIAIVILFMAGLAVAMLRSLESDHPPYIEYAGALANVYVFQRTRAGSRYFDYIFINENGKWKYKPGKKEVIITAIIVLFFVIPPLIEYGLAVGAIILVIVLMFFGIAMAIPALYAHSILKKDLQEKGRWAGRKR